MENVKLFLSQKSQFDLVEKIKNKNEESTRASLSQSSEDGKQEKCFMLPKIPLAKNKLIIDQRKGLFFKSVQLMQNFTSRFSILEDLIVRGFP